MYMNIIKLDAIDSTNSYSNKDVSDSTIVTAKFQTKGKGQLGANWESEDSKNLIFSIYKKDLGIKVKDQFIISIIVSLALIKTLKKNNLPNLRIKWPNDIMSENKKICGILIENIVKEKHIKHAVIGIGLNVNQTIFDNLPNASSIKKITGNTHNKDEILKELANNINRSFEMIYSSSSEIIFKKYEELLYRINKPSTFKNLKGENFTGFIKGVNKLGKLNVMLDDNKLESFDLKEISILN